MARTSNDAERTIGPAGDTTSQIDVQRTLPCDLEEAWDLLTSPTGTRIWLGTDRPPGADRGARYKTRDGTRGQILSYRVCDWIRLTWRPKKRNTDTTLEVTLRQTTEGTVFRFQQQRLAGEEERLRMRDHWLQVLDGLHEHVVARAASTP